MKYLSIKQLLIRLAILVAVPFAGMLALLLFTKSPEDLPYRTNVSLGCVVVSLIITVILCLLMTGEMIYLYCRNKTAKANANFVVVIIGILWLCFFYVFIL
ncbi:hypothetical protein [Coprobacter tertius]|uniref:Uncharacterized protein n=1 Tax=Coprobacter tertius TaxID=2944915 RepID=A0ABT1MCZ4_9BACT|nr:hypothetical protein [Coprobacter tertius]MCP9610505.1 hypothetical protein [Coprobacter tertius]